MESVITKILGVVAVVATLSLFSLMIIIGLFHHRII